MDIEAVKGKKRISVTIDTDIYQEFKDYCEANGMKMSSKVERLMKQTVKNTTLKKFM